MYRRTILLPYSPGKSGIISWIVSKYLASLKFLSKMNCSITVLLSILGLSFNQKWVFFSLIFLAFQTEDSSVYNILSKIRLSLPNIFKIFLQKFNLTSLRSSNKCWTDMDESYFLFFELPDMFFQTVLQHFKYMFLDYLKSWKSCK